MRLATIEDNFALIFLPINLRDQEMCLTAVKSSGQVLSLVTENLVDR